MIKTKTACTSVIFFIHSLLFSQNAINNIENTNITTSYDSITIEQYLDSLHSKYQFNFSYSSEFFPKDSVIHANYSNNTIQFILDDIFTKYTLDYYVEDNLIIIKPIAKLNNYIKIQGTIIGKITKKPVPFANIAIQGEPTGTSSNSDGEFTFLIPRKYKNASIQISSLGFVSKTVSVPPKDTIISVELNDISIPIKEVTVVYINPKDIIEKTRANIQNNYSSNAQLLSAFFRETIKQDEKYTEISEAILSIYKDPYLIDSPAEKVKFIKGRKSSLHSNVSLARLKLAGGPALFATIDIAKNQKFISEEENLIYEYKLLEKTIEFGRVMYIIGFKPTYEEEDIYYKGEIHIDAETYAIAYAKFEMTKKTLKRSNKILIQKEAPKIKSLPTVAAYEVFYRPIGNKWILNRVNGTLIIKMLDKRDKKSKTLYQAVAELLVTNSTDISKIPFKNKESFKTNFILSDKITDYDPEFWKDYNIIKPEEDLIHVLKNSPVEINLIPIREKTRP